jgi:hypothetical protein
LRAGRPQGPPRGASRVKVLVFLLVVGAVWYLGSKFIPPYWSYLSLQDPVKEALVIAARGNEAAARNSIIKQARETGLALTDEDIEFIRNGPMLKARVAWTVPVDLPRYRYNLQFNIEHTTPLP